MIFLIGETNILAVSSDSRYLVTRTGATSLTLLDIIDKKAIHLFAKISDAEISNAIFTPDSKYIVCSFTNKSIKLLDIGTKKEACHIKDAHKGEISSLAVTPNNKYIVSASHDFSIKMFDIETKEQIHEFPHAHDCKETFYSNLNLFTRTQLILFFIVNPTIKFHENLGLFGEKM